MKGKGLPRLVASICVVLVIASLSFIAACAQESAPAPSPAPAPAPSPAPAPAPQVFELKFSSMFPPSGGPTVEGSILIDLLNKASNGKIQVKMYDSSSLGAAPDFVDMLKNDICDIATISGPMFPTRFSLMQGVELPMLGIPNWAAATFLREEMYASGYTQGFEDLKLLAFNILRPQCMYLKKKVLKAEDLNGLKVRSPDPKHLKPFEQFGLSIVAMPMADVYMSLERGIIDGAVTGAPENFVSTKWYEVLKYGIENPLAYGGTYMVMSKHVWDSLPADVQLIFEQVIPQWRFQAMMFYQDLEAQSYAELEKAGLEVYRVDASEYARWQEAAIPVINQWTDEREAEGLPGKEFIDLIRKIAKRYS